MYSVHKQQEKIKKKKYANFLQGFLSSYTVDIYLRQALAHYTLLTSFFFFPLLPPLHVIRSRQCTPSSRALPMSYAPTVYMCIYNCETKGL